MNRAGCPICSSGAARAVWRLQGSRTSRSTSLYHCPACDSYFQRPDYSEDDEALRGDLEWHLGHQAACMREADELLPLLLRLHPHGSRLLDIGCGTGSLMSVALRCGLSCEGIEPNKYAVRHARETGSLRILEGYFSAARYDSKFDFVIIDSVLEHVPDPSRMIREALEVLNPGGLLYVSVPNRIGGVLRIVYSALFPLSKFSLFVDNDAHINHFSRRSLLGCVKSSGGDLVLERVAGQYVFRSHPSPA